MSFNLKRFLRRISTEMLRQYLDTRKISLSDRVDWQDPMQTQPDALCAAISGLTQHDREAIITDFENVEQLCDRVGQIALHSVAAADSRVLHLLQSADGDEGRGITLLLAHGALFERAISAAYADRLRNGRSWSAFNIDAATPVGLTAPNLAAFEAELAVSMARPDGSIGKLKIDTSSAALSVKAEELSA